MEKRARKFGVNVKRMIGDDKVVEVLHPYNATKILKNILDFNGRGEEPTPSIIARNLSISPSTVVRNIERFDKIYLVETEEKGRNHKIRLTKKGERVARILENSETIDLIEKNRERTELLININKNLTKDLSAVICVRQMRMKELKRLKDSLEKEIKSLSEQNELDSKIRMKKLQQRLVTIDHEIIDTQSFINEKEVFFKELKGETRNLQHKLDEFLPTQREVIE